jgi:uracil phosphoribosyltransferase
MFLLSKSNSLANRYIAELRDKEIQKDALRFRKNLERLGEIFAYEISKSLNYKSSIVKTPLGEKEMIVPAENPVLVTVLRAGLPFHQGLLNFFDQSENAFIGAYRGIHDKKENFEIEMNYISSPDIQGKTLIICDPMLATGKSIEKAYHAMLRFGIPSRTHIVSVVASQRGIRYLSARMSECRLWIGDVDPDLNTKSYIVPGLGDAGDLAFGPKN